MLTSLLDNRGATMDKNKILKAAQLAKRTIALKVVTLRNKK